MLIEAAFWRGPDDRPPPDAALADPELSKLIENWGRTGDVGYLAIDQYGSPVGAAWYRFWTKTNHSYGFVDNQTPEIAIGVVAEHRGKGIGRRLLAALIVHASENGIEQLSLSVEKDNPALRLYEKSGFKNVGELRNAWTMVVDTASYEI